MTTTTHAHAAGVTVSPSRLSFGSQVLGIASAVKNVTLTNGTNKALTISGIATTLSDYSETSNCPLAPSTLASGATCTISVTFTPAALGSRSATLEVNDSAGSSPQKVALGGTGIAAISAAPTSLSFGNQVIGKKSTPQKVTVKNTSTASITVNSIATDLTDFTTTTSCPLAPNTMSGGATCSVSVFFTPAATGTRNSTLTISTSNGSRTVGLSGAGIEPATVNSGSLTFAGQALGTTSPPQGITFTNNQSTALKITAIISGASDFGFTTTCPLSPNTLAAGTSCSASVTFAPKATGIRTGVLSFNDNASNSPQTVPLTGTGNPATLVSIALTPASSSVAAGLTQQFTATGNYTDGSTQDLTSTATWASTATNIATISSSGLASGTAQGTSTITATSGSVSGSATLTVTPPILTSIAVTPANASLANGTTQPLTATGTYSDGSTLNITNSVAWSTGNAGIATISTSGVASGTSVGSTTVTATLGSVSGSNTLTVTPATLVSIAVTPALPNTPLGTTQQFTATGTFTDGSTQNLTATVNWSSSQISVVTISNNTGSQGLATSVATGSASINATSGSVSGSTTITIVPAALVSIAVSPSGSSIALGTTQQFTATGTFTDGSTQNVTGSATWGSDTPAVATINTGGLATGTGTGSANISATSGTVTGSTALTVTPAQLVSIAVSPSTASIAAGTTQQFTALGTYTDGSTQDLTTVGHWSSSDGSDATVSNTPGSQGLASALTPGATTISLISASVTGSAALTVTPAVLVSIAITPQSPDIALGTTQQFTALGTYSDNSTQDITSVVTWSSTSAGIAVISNTAGSNGLATSAGVGNTTIGASLGTVSASTPLAVGTAALVSISITPSSVAIALGATQQFDAVGTYTDGSTQDLTSSATWSSYSTAIASITQGLAQGNGPGTTTVSATSGSITGTATLTVSSSPALVLIAVTPSTTSIGVGATTQFTATGSYSNGTIQVLTGSVAWTSSNSAVATISSASGSPGMATGVTVGSVTITATLGAVSGNAALAVPNSPCSGPCVVTYHYDIARDGVSNNEQTLTPANVNSISFGRVATMAGLNGQIYAQPLYISGLYNASSKGNVVLVATEGDYAYAFDADTYQQIWGGSYIPAGETPVPAGAGQVQPCTNIEPSIGITGTPVIDPYPNSNPNPVMYFVTKSVDTSQNYHQRLHAVDVITGVEVFGAPVEITTPAGSPEPFDAFLQNQRPGLAMTYDANSNPQVYIAWASHCDTPEYHGWVMKFTVTSGVLGSSPSAYFLATQGLGTEGGIWMGGGAPAVDNAINGNLYLVTGNGAYDGVINFGNSIVKLNSNLGLADWYTPNNWLCLDGIAGDSNCPNDRDLGSGGVVLFNVADGVPELLTADKDGEFYVVYQSNMGHLDPATPTPNYAPPTNCTSGPPYPTGATNNIAQCFLGISPPVSGAGGLRSTPAFWNNTVYVAGAGDALRAYSLSSSPVGAFNTTGAAASTPSAFVYPASPTVVSWNGSNPSTGVLWTLQLTGFSAVPPQRAILRAYAAVPSGSSISLLYQSTVGPGSIKFQVPTVANGKVFVGGQGFSGTGTEGQLYVYGLCPCD